MLFFQSHSNFALQLYSLYSYYVLGGALALQGVAIASPEKKLRKQQDLIKSPDFLYILE